MSKTKKLFEVQDNESISDCLDRMQNEGYQPVRRMEKPVFKEVKQNGKVEYVPAGQKIVFEGKILS
ncbi:NETI motif-containing protein [Falsibacillus albus]|uniref:NETI motif-containing protein n=1 Tax=Falsibacillus albus TaxID=2478915 RepID=A0A3L7JJL2_9BACI|nr:NETI motif-containing protein [Falsibacillus albus]RLQ90660.1 NETI motif-containing protein [Falsibacillus albus]